MAAKRSSRVVKLVSAEEVDVARERLREALRAMTPAQVVATATRAGIYTPSGRLTKRYREGSGK